MATAGDGQTELVNPPTSHKSLVRQYFVPPVTYENNAVIYFELNKNIFRRQFAVYATGECHTPSMATQQTWQDM